MASGWLVAGEKLVPELFIGGALVISGTVLIVTFPSLRPANIESNSQIVEQSQ
jgi:drug/metabolite transporter (DMT)-like permease